MGIFKNSLNPIMLDEDDTKLGGVETFLEAQKCANLFKANKDKIERCVILQILVMKRGSHFINLSDDVPVLVQATPDDLDKCNPQIEEMPIVVKFQFVITCINMALNILLQKPCFEFINEFDNELDKFISVCKIVKGMRRVRIGAVGASYQAFNSFAK